VIRVAQLTHEILDEVGAQNLVKTSGKTGLHIYVPLGAQYRYEQARQFAHLIVQLVHRQLPDITSLERHPKKRRGKIYLDYLQNSRGQTLAAPYSLRPKPGAPVSTPLDWSELHPDLSPQDFNYYNIQERLKARVTYSITWAPVLTCLQTASTRADFRAPIKGRLGGIYRPNKGKPV
jgi:bifunctional non-homologous end joining protein LigD